MITQLLSFIGVGALIFAGFLFIRASFGKSAVKSLRRLIHRPPTPVFLRPYQTSRSERGSAALQ